MLKAHEYRRHAADCRTLAAQMESSEHRDQLLEMAAAWDRMADERERALRLGEPAPFQPMVGRA